MFSKENEKRQYDYKADYRCDTMLMLEIFTKSKVDRNLGVKPSVYAQELYMSHEERQNFLNLNNDCIKLFPNRSLKEVIEKWDVKPRIILFTKWDLGEEYETFFTVRNRYRTSKLLKLALKDSPVFELEKLVNFNRLGSMVTFGYKVRFRPKEFIDYHDTIKLEAENGTLEIYILAISPRPMIDFPDKIDFGNVLINFHNSKEIRLENLSPIVVEASLETQGIFSLDCNKILLNPNEAMILKISLNEKKKKKIHDKLLVHYQTGERLYINLSAKCYSGHIFFESKQVIDMGELFVGLSATERITLANDSDELLSYVWMNNRNILIDDLEYHINSCMLGNKFKLIKKKTDGMKYYKMITDQMHQKISNNFIEEELDTKPIYWFTDQNFYIQPAEGQINPKSKQTFVITFKPVTVNKICKKAYLEIEGLKERLKVKLKGLGIGPNIVLNVNTIDFDQIFICSQHTYILNAKNIGLVKGTIMYLADSKLTFGETINCSPVKLELLPGEVKVFEMTLSSTVAGSFVEDVWFVIEESQKRVRCIVKGHIINPRLILNKKIINFGPVSLGFKYTSSFTITNESPIPVEYKIEVVGNGFLPAVQINSDFEDTLPLYPQEFTIDPEKNQIHPGFSQIVEVSLVSNIVREYSTVLKIYLWEVLVEECSLILKYTSIAPIITCKPNEILLRYAFIDYDYTRQITLINSHNLPTYYIILHQDETKIFQSPALLYNLDDYSGYLGPNSSKVIHIEIRILSLKPAVEKLKLRVFGLPHLINLCTIVVYGMGPVVNPSTFTMSWGTIPVLKNIEKSLVLINVSPICAFYKMQVEKYPLIWDISTPEGSIAPESEFEIIITAMLKDSGIIEDNLIVEVIGSREIVVSLSAYGYGTSIVTVPNLFPVYDIGKVFRKEKHNDTIKVTNAGSRHHTIMFTTMKEIKNLTKAKADQEQGTYFKLIPYKLDLEGGETQEMHLLYEWDKIEVLEDTYYCYAIIERRGKRVTLGSSTIRASFTDTELTFEPTSLHFRVDVPKWSTPVLPQYKTLIVSSQWSHTLFLHCEVKKPFAFKNTQVNKSVGASRNEEDILNLKLEPEESQALEVKFDPLYISNRYSRVCYAELIVTFKDHKVKACVPLRGEVNFPNIQLSTHEINFGCVRPNTETMQYAVLTNNTPLVIEYEWYWAQQRLSELKPHSLPELKHLEFEEEHKEKLSEEKSDFNYNEEEFFEGGEEEGGKDEISENIPLKTVFGPVIITQLLSDTASSTDLYYSENLTEQMTTSSAQDTDEVDSSPKDYSDEKTPDLYIGRLESKSTHTKRKRNNDGGYFVESINEFGINEILRKIPSTAHKSIVSQVIDIIPPKGELKPHDTQQVTFVFSPSKLMKIIGKALLMVSGGPDETVTFKGSCYYPVYELIPPQINFGFGPFCELWCSSLFLCNKGLKDIQVAVNIPEFDPSAEQTEVILLLPEKFGTSPKATFIPSFEIAAYKIALFPGRIGEIVKEFTIQIDDLPPVTMTMKGYALPHQIHIALPRRIEPFLYENMYNVIASLTSQWFSSKEGQQNYYSMKLAEGNVKLSDDAEGWELVPEHTVTDITIDDINMAYERLLCEMISMTYNGNIPHATNILGMNYLVGFEMPPYSLDFGSVIINTKAQCMIVYTNYCPKEAIIKINFPENSEDLLDRYGVVLKPLCSHTLQPFETKQFAILLRPPHNTISRDEIEESIAFTFNFKVSCGPTIPVNVTASITKPYLCTPDSFDFGYVKIGYKRYMKCIVSNINTVDCEWFAFIRPLRTYRFSDPDFNERVCPFTVNPVYGYTEPKSKFIITIGFEPMDEALYDVVLQFIINMNPQSVAIRLKGCGLKPHLTADRISFGYSIPYSMPLRERLTIRNPCLFPVQAYVLGNPKDFPREQDLFNILLKYYRKDKICVPSTYYRNKPTYKLYMMFRRLVRKAVRKYIKDILEFLDVILTESPKVWKLYNSKDRSLSPKAFSNIITQTKLKKGEKTQPKTPKGKKNKDKHKSEKSKDMLLFIKAVLEENFVVKTLKQVINDYIKYMSLMNISPSNLTLCGKVPLKEETHFIECGNLMIVYGSPNSDAGKFTWRVGHYWNISVVSLDWEIINDLIERDFGENRLIRGIIMEYFLKNFEEEKDKYDPNTLEGLERIISLVGNQYFLELQMQKEVSESKSKNLNHKRIVDSFKEPVTLLNIPWKYLQHIIVNRLYSKSKNGLVLESIVSNFFFDPVSTLMVILNVFQASRIHIMCLCDDADRVEICIDKSAPDANVIQAFSNLHYLDFFSLPEYIRENMVEELKKSNKKNLSDDDEEETSATSETNKEVQQKRTRNIKGKKGKTNQQSVKDQDSDKNNSKKQIPAVEKKIELPDKRKTSSKLKIILSEQSLQGPPSIPLNEYLENLKKIQGFIETQQNTEVYVKNTSYRFMMKLRLDDRYKEIMKKKAKLSVIKKHPFNFWIFCSHKPYKDYQFENYLPLVERWKTICEKPKKEKSTSNLQLENHNYFVIKKKVEKLSNPKTEWENQCKLFKIVNVDENIFPSEPVIAYTNVSRSKLQIQVKPDVKINKGIEMKKSSNIEIVDNLLKDVEITYHKEMDHRLKILNSKFKSGVKIKPGGSKQYDILFYPTGCSTYEQDFNIRIGGCDEVKKILVSASCDIPDILFDPCYIFSNIIIADNIADASISGYVIKNKAFHFGTALVGHEDDERLFQVESVLKLKNTSAIDVKLSVSIIEEKIETGKVPDEEVNDKTDLEVVKQFLKRNKILEGQHKVIGALNTMKNDNRSQTDVTNNQNLELLYSSSVFGFGSPEINIEAGEEKKFTISACPPLEGCYSCRYLFSVENNPKVYTLKAFCSGTSPKVIFNPVELFFEDIIIYRQISQPFSLENKCGLPLTWEIVNADSIHPKISLNNTRGTLKPESLEVVYVTYHPTEVQEICEQFIIQIFDEKVKGKTLQEYKYFVHMRSYDVFTEVYFERTNGNSLNLESIVVFQKIDEVFGVRNRGRSDIVVKIFLNKDCSYLGKQVEVVLKDSVVLLNPQIPFQSELSITCFEEVKLEEEPLVILEILDHSSMKTVAKIPLYISLQSHFSRFTLSPTHNLNFGNMLVGELKLLEIILVNCGAIDFKFRFIPEKRCYSEEKKFLQGLNPNSEKKKCMTMVNQSRNFDFEHKFKTNFNNIIFMNKFLKMKNAEYSKNTSKPRNNFKCLHRIIYNRQWKYNFHLTRSKVKKLKNQYNYYDLVHIKTIQNIWKLVDFDDLKMIPTRNKTVSVEKYHEEIVPAFGKCRKLKCYVPPFRIVPAFGKLGVGKEVAIKVHCNPLFRSTFLETVNLFVTDALPEVKRGFPIELSVESCLPKVNFEDYNSIFREIEVVADTCNEHITDENVGEPYEVFCIEEHSLYILNTIIGTSRSITAFLHSENQLDAAVLVTLSSLSDDNYISPFSINEKDSCVVYIKPYGYSSFNIIFSPKNQEECRAIITMSLEVPNISKDKGWFSSITVIGKGNYPNIIMKLVGSVDEESEMIDYGVALINSSQKKNICLHNVGNVTAQVILEVLNNKDIFLIQVLENLEENLEICNADTFMNTKVSIAPKKKCEFQLEFKPKELITYSSRINVHILFNPFEVLFINVYGKGYSGDLVIAGLKFTYGEPVTFGSHAPAEYFLDFGFCIIDKKYIKEFTLISYCANIIKFKFDTYERVTFIPSSGHIFPGSKKKILSVLQISDCIQLDETVACNYQEIIYKGYVHSKEWDNTNKSVKWTKVEGDSLTKENFHKAQILKIERYDDEPEYNILKEEVCLLLTVSAVVDIPKLTVNAEFLEFSSVTVSQSSVREIVIQNTKHCEVSWTAVITDERSEIPNRVPQVTDFSFGKFDYELVELPITTGGKAFSFKKQLFSISSLMTNEKKALVWNNLRKKHIQSLYGKSVTIILPKPKVEKEPEKDPDTKSLKKNYRLKSRSRSLMDIKKRSTFKKRTSAISLSSGRKDSKVWEGKRGSVNVLLLKNVAKLGNKKSDAYEFNFSDLVKIGKTHIFLPSELPETTFLHHIESISQCFSINVSSGSLKPNENFTCLVTFTPKHINRYRADLRFYCEATGEFSYVILGGAGILPLCHIEIYEDDYLTINNPIISHLPANTRSVTVESIFIDSFLKKSFKVYNIAEMPYHFHWINVKNSNSSEKGIKCLTVEGEIPPRDSFQMEFSFLPMDYQVFESLWLLKINEFYLEQYILLVFKIRKPLVSFERKFVVCEPTLKGFKKMLNVKLINNEDMPFNYTINESSLYADLKNDKCLLISPMFGVIGPKSEIPLEIEFTPKCTNDVTFYVRVNIHSHIHHLEYEITPLRILSKCYCVVPKISCSKGDGSKHELFHSDIKSDNIITIGKLLLRIPYSLQFNISNAGEYPMYFEIFLSDTNYHSGVSTEIIEKSGVVHPCNSYSITVKFIANKKVDFEKGLIIKICKGPDYFIKVTGTAAEPAYEFSHTSINFGICLVGEKNIDKYHRVLEFSNLDTESILLEKLEQLEGFIVDFSSLIIEPRAVHKILIMFHPVAIKKYSGKLHFLVNGVYKHEIDVMGEGEIMKLSLHERENIIVHFGLLKAKEISSKEIAIVNKSRVPINFSLRTSQQKKNDLFPLTIDVFEKKLYLLPDEIRVVKVSIYAEKRIQNFTSNIKYEGYGIEEILFIVKGTIIDYKFELDQKSILFGSTSLGCVTTKQVALINSGDIGSRFTLRTRFVSDVFAIKPLEGYSPPGSKTIIEISFMANFVTQYCNNMVIFMIENYESITLSITGIGTKFPPPLEVIKFRTNVRTKTYQYVDLINRTYEDMNIYPVITGEYFSTEDFVKLPANSHSDCKVFYYPQTMTTTQYHMGHFFCGFPNGEVLFYQLVGEAKPPIKQELDWECKSRKKFVGKIPLKNWSSSSESFKVEIKKVELTVPAFYKISSHDIVSIPPKKTRNCLITLICYKPNRMSFKVFVTNINSKEYARYEVHVIFMPPEAHTIRLQTPVHDPVFHKICLANPMDKTTFFNFKSPDPDLEPLKKVIQVRPFCKKYLTLKYIPTHVGQSKIFIKINNYLLGETIYKLEVQALECGAEKYLEVQAPIGSTKLFSIPVRNPYKKVVAFIFESDSVNISMKNPSFFVGPGKIIMVDLMYEPTCLGNNLMNFVFHTNGYGDFSYCVKGLCTPAQPSGPLIIFKDCQFEFEFKNVFFYPQDFFFKINNENFTVEPEKLRLNPKKTGLVFITLKELSFNDENNQLKGIPQAGKLTVSCMADNNVPIDWIYYLKAVN